MREVVFLYLCTVSKFVFAHAEYVNSKVIALQLKFVHDVHDVHDVHVVWAKQQSVAQ